MGWIIAIIVGIIGAIVGGWIATAAGVSTATWINWFIFAIIGAVVLLAIVNLFQRGRVR
jgi:uncharacterized membrane protein YeaQ/YmgE (transglycosylase-associated protein family)